MAHRIGNTRAGAVVGPVGDGRWYWRAWARAEAAAGRAPDKPTAWQAVTHFFGGED